MSDNARLDLLLKLRDDFPFYAPQCLRIRTKADAIEPFVLNEAQLEIHRKIEEQKALKGWVRALILKGRQQGCSTYVSGRYYHRASMRKAVNVFILSHEQTASDTLFGMVDRYQRMNPYAPHTGVSNTKELEFDVLESSYAVATAGAKATGRGKATSLFHGSEVAYWANAADHFAASVQSVPLMPGTEIILESTSGGEGGEFYERWQDAEQGKGDYICIFIPWWLTKEYQREPEPGFQLDSEPPGEGEMSESEYCDIWKLSRRQMAWRRYKIIELRDRQTFRREYPAEASEAWTPPPGHTPFINGIDVLRARKRTRHSHPAGPLIIGVDPASNGGDRFSVARRRGFDVQGVEYRGKIDTLEGTQWLKYIIDQERPARMNIDAGNIGAAIITNLKSLGPQYLEVVRGVNFGGTSESRNAKPKVPGPYNRRAEMWERMRDWLQLPEGVTLPDDPALQSDMVAPKLKPRLDNHFLLESKDEMKRRKVRSPDLADSVALTFAFNEYLDNYSQPATVQPFGSPESGPQVHSYTEVIGPQGWMA